MIRADRVWQAVEAVDMRQGIDRLSLRIQEALGHTPCDGSAYAFRNRAGNRIKLLIWDGTGVWLIAQRVKTADGTGLARAIDYTLRRWPAVMRYVGHGHLPIDNNPAENAIRPTALGKKNWHFFRIGARWLSCRRSSELTGHRQTQWSRTLCLAQRHLEKTADLAYSRIDELLPLRPITAE